MNMSFRREAFAKAGLFSNECGFHKGPMAEDNEFSLRIKEKTGKKILYVPEVKLLHRVHKYRLSRKFIKERSYWIGYSRRMMMRFNSNNKNDGTNTLSQEHQLLNRMFTKPAIAWRITWVSVTSLTYVALGYYFQFMPNLLKA